MKKSIVADFSLIMVTFFWGIGFPLVKFALVSVGPLYQIAFRFLIAGILLSIIFMKTLKSIDTKILLPSFILSFSLYITYLLSIVGIKYTTASNSSFYCCLAVIIVPFISYIFYKVKPKKKYIISITMCIFGLFLISYNEGGLSLNLGDILCLLASFTYAFQIVLTEKFVSSYNPTVLAIIQMYFVSFIGFIVALLFEPFPKTIVPISLISIIAMSIFCTAFAFYIQTTAQKHTTATKVSLIFCLEPLFGVIFSCLLLGEIIGIKGIIGGIFIIGSIVISEINFNKINSEA